MVPFIWMSWYYKMGGTTQGPIERDVLTNMLRTGALMPQIEVSEDTATWTIAALVPGLMAEVHEAPAAAQNPATSPPPVATTPPALKPPLGPGTAVPAPPNPMQPAPPSSPSTAVAGPPHPTQPAAAANPVAPNLATAVTPAAAPLPAPHAPSAGSPAPPIATPPQIATPTSAATPPQPAPPATASSSSEALDERDTPATQQGPSGPVAHLTLNPAARQRSGSRSRAKKGGSALKLAGFGLVGLAVLLVGGYFTATKVFGLDLRPSGIDRSVSKFMVEEPLLVLRVDLDSILGSDTFRKTFPASGGSSKQILSYLKDADEVVAASNRLDPENPSFVAIVKLKRDYRKEFVAKLMRDSATDEVGNFQMHVDPTGLGGAALAISLPEPRCLLLGTPYALKQVLERNDYPRLYPRESELIAATLASDKSISGGMFLGFLADMIDEANEKFDSQLTDLDKDTKEMMESMIGDLEKRLDDTQYILENTKHLLVEIELTDRLSITARGECGSNRKAKQVARKLIALMNATPLPGQGNPPVVNGSTIEATDTWDMREFVNGLPQGFAQGNPRSPF